MEQRNTDMIKPLSPGDDIPDLVEAIAQFGVEGFHEMVDDASRDFCEDYLYDFINYMIKTACSSQDFFTMLSERSGLEKEDAIRCFQKGLELFAQIYNGDNLNG